MDKHVTDARARWEKAISTVREVHRLLMGELDRMNPDTKAAAEIRAALCDLDQALTFLTGPNGPRGQRWA